jgi:hypothetical protein
LILELLFKEEINTEGGKWRWKTMETPINLEFLANILAEFRQAETVWAGAAKFEVL